MKPDDKGGICVGLKMVPVEFPQWKVPPSSITITSGVILEQ